MGEEIAQADDVPPGNLGSLDGNVIGQGVDCLADYHKVVEDSIADQLTSTLVLLIEGTAIPVDAVNRCQDVREPNGVCS